MVADVLVNLHPDWQRRVRAIPGAKFRHLNVTVLDPHDLAVRKIARCTERDLEDVRTMAGQLDPDRLVTLYREAMDYWVGPQERFEGSLHFVLRSVFGRELP